MSVLRSAAFGCAVALGAASAHAQSVTTRQIDNEPVETIVTQTPTGTVITRRPIAPAAVPAAPAYGYGAVAPQPYVTPVAPRYPAPAAAAATTEFDETVGVAPTEARTFTVRRPAAPGVSERATTRTTRVTHRARETTGSGARTVRRETRRVVARPLVLTPTQRTVVYRTVVQEQVVPATPVPPAGYPPYPAPAYQPRTVVVAPNATTGYGWTAPAAIDVDEDYVETVPAVAPVPRYTTARYAVGSVLPASVVATPLPARAAVRVPAVQPYSYATIDGRVLLVDPTTNAVVADITP
jgi:hypothetical protein